VVRVAGEDWRQWLSRHRGKILGSAVGFGVGLAVMAWGVLWTLFIGLCVVVGYLVGRFADGEADAMGEWVERFLPPGRR
jgi:uncharacterized membrane protein